LDDTAAAFGGSYVFDATSTVFKLRDHTAVNGNGVDLCCLLLRRDYKASQDLEATQVMEVQMEHLFIQDLNQLFY
jgi:hypothetical protein